MDDILEKVHAGGIGNRDTGFVQVIDSCDAGTAAQSGCLIERAVESITESLPAGIFRVCFMHNQPGDVPFTEMIDDYTEEQDQDDLRGDFGKLCDHIFHGLLEAIIQNAQQQADKQ